MSTSKPLKAYRMTHPQWLEWPYILWAHNYKHAKSRLFSSWMDTHNEFGTFGQIRLCRAPEFDGCLSELEQKGWPVQAGCGFEEHTLNDILKGVLK